MMYRHNLRIAAASLFAWVGLHLLCPEVRAWQDAPRPQAGVAYGMPEGTEKFAAGTLVPYAGYNYVAQGDGTMMLAAQQPNARPLPPPRQPAAPQAANPQMVTTARRIVYVPTTTVIRTVSPGWSYSNWGYGGFGPAYGLGFRSYGWGGWAGPGAWGPFGPFGPPGFGPYIGFW